MGAICWETDRLWMRSFEDADAEVFSEYRSDPEVARYQGWEAPYSLEQARVFIAEMKETSPGAPGKWYQVALERKDTRQVIGDCAFHVTEDGRQAYIGITLARAFHGQGYAFEALRRLLGYLFDELQLHRVMGDCDVENTASATLMERLGMRREGCFIENGWYKGMWCSSYLYAILRREWLERDSFTA